MNRMMAIAMVAGVVCAQAAAQPEDNGHALAAETFRRAREAYAAATSYQDRLQIRYDVTLEDEDENLSIPSWTISFWFEGPNRLALRSQYGDVVCDGEHLWLVDPYRHQYVEEAAPERVDLEACLERLTGGRTINHLLAHVLAKGQAAPELLVPQFLRAGGARAAERDGRQGVEVDITYGGDDWSDMYGGVTGTAWFDAQTGLLGEVTLDVSDAMRQWTNDGGAEGHGFFEHAQSQLKTVRLLLTHERIAINEPIAPSRFELPASAGRLTRAETFSGADPWADAGGWGEESAEGLDVLGQPAPAFSGRTLAGEELSLESLRGKVVVLDFWATWCGPCVAAMPHIQALADEFSGQDVVVIGMNQDRGNDRLVQRFIEEKEITFTQFMDEDGSVRQEYGVSGIPCTVMIDREGVVQAFHVGFSPGSEQTYSQQVRSLLKGEALVDATEIERRRAQAAASAPEPLDLGEVDPDRLGEQPGLRVVAGGFGPYSAVRRDIDGDGAMELIIPGTDGAIGVVSADGSESRTIRLRGERMMVSTAEPLRAADALLWVVAGTAMDSQRMSPTISLVDDQGQSRWTFQPDAPAGWTGQTHLAVADLTGDTQPEIVAGLSMMNFQDPRGGYERQSYLVVFDLSGEVLSQRALDFDINGVFAFTEEDGRPTIGCLGMGRLHKFAFSQDE